MKANDFEGTYTPEELLVTVFGLATTAIELQYDEELRETLYLLLESAADAYGLSIERESPPTHFPFTIRDASNDTDKD